MSELKHVMIHRNVQHLGNHVHIFKEIRRCEDIVGLFLQFVGSAASSQSTIARK